MVGTSTLKERLGPGWAQALEDLNHRIPEHCTLIRHSIYNVFNFSGYLIIRKTQILIKHLLFTFVSL